MARVIVNRGDLADLNHLAEIHDHDPIAQILDDVEVMADEHVGQPELRFQIHQQVEDLCLNRFIERGHRLVENDQARFERQRASDVDALALATAELVRVAAGVEIGREPDPVEQRTRPHLRLPSAQPVHARAERHRLRDRQARVQRGIAVLENHLHVATQLAQGDAVAGADRLAVEDDLAGVGLEQPHQHPSGRRLAAPALANDTQGLALADLERDVVDGMYSAPRPGEEEAVDLEVLSQILHQQQRLLRATSVALVSRRNRCGRRGEAHHEHFL
jgi:hypothetical protein